MTLFNRFLISNKKEYCIFITFATTNFIETTFSYHKEATKN